MRKPRPLVLHALLALLPACGLEEPAAPADAETQTGRPTTTAAAATLIGSTAVDTAGVVGAFSSLVSTPTGRQHVAYYDRSNGALKYATCGSSCVMAANWQKATIAGAGSADVGLYTSLKVDGTGRRHVVYYDATSQQLKYATCLDQANCTTPANWQKVTVDNTPLAGQYASLAVTSNGRRHVSYRAANGLKYATCLTNCTLASGWTKLVVDTVDGSFSSIAVGGDGRRHISYRGFTDQRHVLRYATCLTNCGQAANWQKLTIDGKESHQTGGYTSLALDASGVLHVSYLEYFIYDLWYARCATDCTNSGNWRKTVVDAFGSAGHYSSIAVGGNSRVHISHYDQATGDLDYATCPADCVNSVNWTSPHIDGKSGFVGTYSSVALGGGLVHISYYDATNGNLKYLELTP